MRRMCALDRSRGRRPSLERRYKRIDIVPLHFERPGRPNVDPSRGTSWKAVALEVGASLARPFRARRPAAGRSPPTPPHHHRAPAGVPLRRRGDRGVCHLLRDALVRTLPGRPCRRLDSDVLRGLAFWGPWRARVFRRGGLARGCGALRGSGWDAGCRAAACMPMQRAKGHGGDRLIVNPDRACAGPRTIL